MRNTKAASTPKVKNQPKLGKATPENPDLPEQSFTLHFGITVEDLKSKHSNGSSGLIFECVYRKLKALGYTKRVDVAEDSLGFSLFTRHHVYRCILPETLRNFMRTYDRYIQGHFYVRNHRRDYVLTFKLIDPSYA